MHSGCVGERERGEVFTVLDRNSMAENGLGEREENQRIDLRVSAGRKDQGFNPPRWLKAYKPARCRSLPGSRRVGLAV